MGLTHWGNRALRKNLDETVVDPEHPQAFPVQRAADLMGRLRVVLRAGDHSIVACGYGGQRIEMPSQEIGAVRTVTMYRPGNGTRSQALLVFDKQDRILLRAGGRWDTYGEVARVCQAAGVPSGARAGSVGPRTRDRWPAGPARERAGVEAGQGAAPAAHGAV